VDLSRPGRKHNLDARELAPPFIAGALRGGSHVHVWDSSGDWVSFTYNDSLLNPEIRDLGVCIPDRPVSVTSTHPRSHPGDFFSVLVTQTTPRPEPGTDQIQRACEEGWVGTRGYLKADGTRQERALAFQGQVLAPDGTPLTEVFIVDLPKSPGDLAIPGDGPLAGDATHRPAPPRLAAQRRLTFTGGRKFPGVQGTRHWLRSSADGSRIGFLMKDDDGTVQFWTVSPQGGPPVQITHNPWPIGSAFDWCKDGRHVAHVLDGSIALTHVATGQTQRLTPKTSPDLAPRPEACVVSPDQKQVAYVRRVPEHGKIFNQIFVLPLPPF
jgi:hypothetical protein